MQDIGGTKDVISRYEDYLREKERLEQPEVPVASPATEQRVAHLRSVTVLARGNPVEISVEHLSDLEVIVDFEIFDTTKVQIGFAIDRNDGLCCYADNMKRQGLMPFQGPGHESPTILFRNIPLLNGAYKFVIFLLDETGICIFDRKESSVIHVSSDEKKWGVCSMEHEWKL